MRALKSILIFSIVALLLNCVPSINPLYTEKDLVFETKLLGKWVGDDNDNIWEFAAPEGSFNKETNTYTKKRYKLTYTENEDPKNFDVHLLKINDRLFLDTFPEEPDIKNSMYVFHLIPGHLFWKIEIEENQVTMAVPNHEWFGEKKKAGELNIEHEVSDDMIILTASTEELQKFFTKHYETENFWSDPVILKPVQ